MNRIAALFFAAPLLAVSAIACSSANGPSLDPADTNCNIVCEQAQKCGPTTFDVNSCENECETKSNDDTYKASVSDCATCVNGASCAASASCASNCLSTITGS